MFSAQRPTPQQRTPHLQSRHTLSTIIVPDHYHHPSEPPLQHKHHDSEASTTTIVAGPVPQPARLAEHLQPSWRRRRRVRRRRKRIPGHQRLPEQLRQRSRGGKVSFRAPPRFPTLPPPVNPTPLPPPKRSHGPSEITVQHATTPASQAPTPRTSRHSQPHPLVHEIGTHQARVQDVSVLRQQRKRLRKV